jgi:hypothetical protein
MVRDAAPPAAVIARLDRATQYSRAAVIEPKGRGVLDPPLSRRMTTVYDAREVLFLFQGNKVSY